MLQRTESPLAPSDRIVDAGPGALAKPFMLLPTSKRAINTALRSPDAASEGRGPPKDQSRRSDLLLYAAAFLRNNPELPTALTTLSTIACVTYCCGKEGQPVSR
jgi:hypothetical protein